MRRDRTLQGRPRTRQVRKPETRIGDPTLRRMTTTACEIAGDEIIIQGVATTSRESIGQARLCLGQSKQEKLWARLLDAHFWQIGYDAFRLPAIALGLPHARGGCDDGSMECCPRRPSPRRHSLGFSKAEVTPRAKGCPWTRTPMRRRGLFAGQSAIAELSARALRLHRHAEQCSAGRWLC